MKYGGLELPVSAAVLAAAVAIGAATGPLAAQILTGRVLDEVTDTPVIGALIIVVDERGDRILQAESDSVGRYRLRLPGPGAYRLAAERLGYEQGETPLLDLSFEGGRTLDLVLTPTPIGLGELEAKVSSERALERSLRHFGIAPGELSRTRIVTTEEIEAVAAARDFGDVLSRQNIAGLQVFRDAHKGDLVTCVQVRISAGCATIVIDGVVASLHRAALLPAEAWETMVVLLPHQAGLLFGTQEQGRGAVLLFSRGRTWR